MSATLDDLERRVTALESEILGEQRLSRRLFEFISELRDDVALLRKHAMSSGEFVQAELEQVKSRLGRLEDRVGGVEAQISALRRDIPGIVGDAVREAFRESR